MNDVFKNLKTKRQSYIDLDNKSDDSVSTIIDLRFKSLLVVPEESYDIIQRVLETQNKYFQRFMKTVAMNRTKFHYSEKHGW